MENVMITIFAILGMMIMAYFWRCEIKERGKYANHFELALDTFVVTPFFGGVVGFLTYDLINMLGFWLVVIILVVLLVLTFVYWDCILKYMSDKRGE